SYLMRYIPSKVTMSTVDRLMLMLLYEGWSFDYKFEILTKGIFGKSAPLLWPTNATVNLMDDIPKWKIPVFIIQGEKDHWTETSVAKAYFDSLKAPIKEFHLFEETGHFASAENPEKYRSIVINSILKAEQ
ncbi:MAG: alpha/beta hydrolase, partial [Balneolaceae bacterium]|nr:alpha/beta hydrolase [Balneolaceae bacterium]